MHSIPCKLALALSLLAVPLAIAIPVSGPLFVGVGLETADAIVPPGGTLQVQVFLTEPKPIKGGRQRLPIQGPDVTQVNGAGLFSPDGDVCGVAVLTNGSTRVYFSSPLSTYGESLDYPVMVFTRGVPSNATLGDTVKLNMDMKTAQWFDPNGDQYPLEEKSGVMTVGGTLSVSDVEPSFGTVPAGATITVSGMGFQPDSVVDVNVNNVIVATSNYINSTEIQITLNAAINIEGVRVRVTNKNPRERVEFYPFPRTVPVGASTHALVKASYPMFSHDTWSLAYLRPLVQGTEFTALAVQNLNASTARIRVSLYSSNGKLLAAKSGTLASNRRISRDLQEIFPGLVTTGTVVRITSNPAIQVLGMQGDDASGEMLPVIPTSQP
jgi:IPT/TIG domain-containing protein